MISSRRHSIEVEVGGVQHGGWYQIGNGLVRVHAPFGIKAAQVRGTAAEALARKLLRELVETEKRRPDAMI
jgi:hypothetical protein